jgi:hypothetical protein
MGDVYMRKNASVPPEEVHDTLLLNLLALLVQKYNY